MQASLRSEPHQVAVGSMPPWIDVLAHIDPRFGGIVSAVPRASKAAGSWGRHRAALAAFCAPDESGAPEQPVPTEQFPLSRSYWLRHRERKSNLRQRWASADAFHIHGLWDVHCAMAAAVARESAKPYIVSAHGMLERWALRHNRWRKRIYSSLVEKRTLRGARCLRALTLAEAEDYRRFGLRGPVAVVPNGVDVPDTVSSYDFLERYPAVRGKRLILFLSRLHPKKGVYPLCRAWSRVSKRFADAHLVFAGPDFANTRQAIESLVDDNGMGQSVTLTGMLEGPLKWSALAAAETFVLPSYSEGLAVSVLEALGSGVPVIITKTCNLPEVAARQCGWEIDPTEHDLERALVDALAASVALREQMAQAGRQLVAERYTWRVVGRQLADLYGWVLGGLQPTSFEVLN